MSTDATWSRTALLLSTHPPGGHSGPGARGLTTLEALRSCCGRVDAVSLATPQETVAHPNVRLISRPDPPSRWGFLAALVRGGSSFVPDRGNALVEQVAALTHAGHLLSRYDLIWSHFSLMARSGLSVPATARVLDVDNSWGAIRRRAATQATGSPIHRAYRRLDAGAVALEERRRANRYEHVVVASERERMHLSGLRTPVSVLPNAVAPAPVEIPPAEAREGLLFVGTLDTEPNVEAVRFLVEEVLPRVRARCPEARLTVAGRNPTPGVRLLCTAADAQVVADAPSLEPLYAGARVVVAPLRLGGGTHIKVIEAMARRQAIVASTVAVEGLGLREGTDFALAHDAATFADRCSELLEDASRAQRMGTAAHKRWHELYRPENARRMVVELVERLAPKE